MTQTLSTLIGLILVFAITALFCSAIVEIISTALQRRAKYLITGLRSMFDAPEAAEKSSDASKASKLLYDAAKGKRNGTGPKLAELTLGLTEPPAGESQRTLTANVLAHPMIRSLQTRRVLTGGIRNPQYIPATTLAQVLIATLLRNGAPASSADPITRIRETVANLPPTARDSLTALIDQAGGSLQALQTSIEGWYDAQMGRIAGWYKRWTKAVLLIVGLFVAVVFNLDAIQIGHTLWVNEPVRAAVSAQAASGALCDDGTAEERFECSQDFLAELHAVGLPVGPPVGCALDAGWAGFGECFRSDLVSGPGELPVKLVGWLIVGVAVTFGAPFWFDALSKVGNLRTSGTKPARAGES